MFKWLFPLILLINSFAFIHSTTITRFTISSFTQTFNLNFPSNGFRIEITANGYRLIPQNDQTMDIPIGRFHVTSNPTNNILVTQWDNYPNVPSPFPSFIVQNPFTVVRRNGQFRIQSSQQFELPGSSFYVERISQTQSRITASGSSSTSSSNTQTGSSGTNQQIGGNNNPSPQNPSQQEEPLQDRTKADGTTDCGPNIANLCNNPLYAQLMRDQCPATCANLLNVAAPAQIQTMVAPQPQFVAPSAQIPIYPAFPVIFDGFGRRNCCCGKKR